MVLFQSLVDVEAQKDFLVKCIMDVLSMNEVSNNPAFIYGISDADGWRTGKSGTTFGRSQFDMNVNFKNCKIILSEAGFTSEEIDVLKNQNFQNTQARDFLNSKFRTKLAKEVIDKYDRIQAINLFKHVIALLQANNIEKITLNGIVAIADYHNQIGAGLQGGLATWLRDLSSNKCIIDHSSVLLFKFSTKWGLKRPDDVRRRASNLDIVCSEIINIHYLSSK